MTASKFVRPIGAPTTAELRNKILELLREQPRTRKELATAIDVLTERVTNSLSALKEAKQVHIASYRREPKASTPSAIYGYGHLPDAKPLRKKTAAKAAAEKRRERAEEAARVAAAGLRTPVRRDPLVTAFYGPYLAKPKSIQGNHAQ